MDGAATGTYTFLFTDIEGSTALERTVGERYPDLLVRHQRLMRAAIEAHEGEEVSTEGDSFFVIFGRASSAVAAALEAQVALNDHDWGDHPVRVRMGIHTGEASLTPAGWVGLDINQAARVAAAGHGGQVLVSEATAQLVADKLPAEAKLRDLGAHNLKDIPLPQRLFQLAHESLTAELPPLRTAAPATRNIPQPTTTLVGRDDALDELEDLLKGHRLVTLTGGGGAGKTRLAVELARRVAPGYAGGVWLVELAPITDGEEVLAAVATIIGASPRDESLGEAVVRVLTGRRALLVLDNCEQVVDAATKLAERWLLPIEGLTILATSREPLAASGEQVWAVPPLGVAAVGALSDSARLFVERSRAAGGTIEITRDAESIERICARLDGLPLAIELAAACTRMLPVADLESRLDDRFRLLNRGSRGGPARHQTLRAAVDWSYELLADPERILLRRLSVFSGGFDLDAAEAVCAGDELAAFDVFDMLARLVDTSLVVRVPTAGHARFTMLETVRSYAAEKCDEEGEGRAASQHHAAFFARLAADAAAGCRTPKAATWLDRLDRDEENMKAAIGYLLGSGGGAKALELTTNLATWWRLRGRVADVERWMGAALAAAPGAPARERALAHWALASAAKAMGHHAEAIRLADDALAIARDAGDAEILVHTLLGALAARFPTVGIGPDDDRLAQAEKAAGDDLALRADVCAMGVSLKFIQGDLPGAQQSAQEALALARESANPLTLLRAMQTSLVMPGPALVDEAQALEVVTLAHQLGDGRMLAQVSELRANAAERVGDLELAIAQTEEAIALGRDTASVDQMEALEAHLRRRRAMLDGNSAEVIEQLEAQTQEARANASPRLMMLLMDLGTAYAETGRLDRANEALEELAALCETGMPMMAVAAWGMIGENSLYVGDLERAEQSYTRMKEVAAAAGEGLEALVESGSGGLARAKGEVRHLLSCRRLNAQLRQAGHPFAGDESESLFDIAGDAHFLGDLTLAGRLLGAHLATAESTGSEAAGPIVRLQRTRLTEDLDARLGTDELDRLLAEGRALDEAGRAAAVQQTLDALESAAAADSP